MQLLSSRSQLDSGTTYRNQPVFVEAVEAFNDRTLNSGGLIQPHPAFDERRVDPENVGPGILETKAAWDMFMAIKKEYAQIMINFHASGQRRQFVDFCGPLDRINTDVLYMYFCLQSVGNPELSTFCEADSIVRHGFDIGAGRPSTDTNVTSSTPQSAPRKRRVEDAIIHEMKRHNNIKRINVNKLDGHLTIKSMESLFRMQIATSKQRTQAIEEGDRETEAIATSQLHWIQLQISQLQNAVTSFGSTPSSSSRSTPSALSAPSIMSQLDDEEL